MARDANTLGPLAAPSLIDWVALSDMPLANGAWECALDRGMFVAEVALPMAQTTVLLDWQPTGIERTFSIFLDGDSGLSIFDRQGRALTRHVLRGPLPVQGGTARISFGWNTRADRWVLTYQHLVSGETRQARGQGPIRFSTDQLSALCETEGAATRHPALLWFGITRGLEPPTHAPWIGLNTPVETARGPVPAGSLRRGDMVVTADSGLQPVLALHRFRLPSRGSFAPVVLRAPFLGQSGDLLLSADQLLAIGGVEVEYLFGEEEVLLRAGDIAHGRLAHFDTLRAATDCVAVDLGLPELIEIDGLRALSHRRNTMPYPRKILHHYEAQQLIALFTQRTRHGAA